MIVVISPAKTLDFQSQPPTKKHTIPEFLDDSQELVDRLAKKSKSQLAKLMSISAKLAALNVKRYRDWNTPFTPDNSKQAILAFRGDVYLGFDCEDWKAADFTFAQKQLRIPSGLYGLLRPLDLIQPYRLEMGRPLVGLSAETAVRTADLKRYLHRYLYQHHRIERMKDKSRRILEALYQRYFENPRLLPDDTARRMENDGLERTIADYIAGMTDRYAIQEHRRLFDPSVRV